MILAHDSEHRFIVSTTAPRPAHALHPRSSVHSFVCISSSEHSAPRISVLGGGLTLSYARCSPVAEGTPDPAFPGNGTPTCEVPKRFQVTHTSFSHPASGWAAGLCTGRWIGSSSRRRSRWNSPACHPHNAVHSRGKGICTMPHLFAARSGDALMPGPLGVAPTSLSLSRSLALPLSPRSHYPDAGVVHLEARRRRGR